MASRLDHAIERLYSVFGGYPRPDGLTVCDLCASDEVDPGRLATARRVRDWSAADLVAVHVLSLPADAMRHFLPRVLETLLGDQWQAFEFGLSAVQGMTRDWPLAERDAIRGVLEAVWDEVLAAFPAALGYVSSASDVLELADQLDVPVAGFLLGMDRTRTRAADLHLATLVETAYMTSGSAASAPLKRWLARPAIGQRLEEAFYQAGDDAAAVALAEAHELWRVCTPPG